MTGMKTAVVIPAYNAQRTLPSCLRALASQTMPPEAIIVVDDGSTDQTAEVAGAFSGVRCVRQANAGPAAARNRGFRESQPEIVLFTDADCVPAEDWVERAVSGFAKEGVGAVAGSYSIMNPESRLARGIHQEIMFRHRRLMPPFPRSFGSYNVAIRGSVFESVGGFDTSYPSASGEDNDLSYRIRQAGHKIYFEPASKVGHYHPERLRRYLAEQYRHGYWRAKMYRDHPRMAGGDDYTFWKDGLEVGLAGLLTGAVAAVALGLPASVPAALLILLLALQVGFSIAMCQGGGDIIFYAGVMTVRSFARALGFSSGILDELRNLLTKKK